MTTAMDFSLCLRCLPLPPPPTPACGFNSFTRSMHAEDVMATERGDKILQLIEPKSGLALRRLRTICDRQGATARGRSDSTVYQDARPPIS